MLNLLSDSFPWYVAGHLCGVCIVTLCAVTIRHVGVGGSYVMFLDAADGRFMEADPDPEPESAAGQLALTS